MASDSYPTLAILPWCKLKADASLGQVDFISWELGEEPARELFIDKENLDLVMSSYVDAHGAPIDKAAIAVHRNAGSDGSISEEEIHDISLAAQLLAFAGIAQNEYFPLIGQGTNSTCFRVIFQRIAEDNGIAISISHRSTGGILDGGWKHGDVHLTLPLQCQYTTEVRFEDELTTALTHILENENSLSTRLLRSIRVYTYAYTDDSYFPEEQETIMMMMAYEGLFRNCKGGVDLACKISTFSDEYGMVTVDAAKREIASTRSLSKEMWLHRAWVLECYKRRNDYVHGNRITGGAWSANEHLVFASWLFPFLVKLILSTKGNYKLSEKDENSLYAIDFILDSTDWRSRAKDSNRSNWKLAEERGAKEALTMRLHEAVKKYKVNG